MSRYQAYPAYRDSGVSWLGKNPSHWTITAIKYGYEITLGKMLQKEASSPTDELKPYLKAINIQISGISILNVEEMWFSISELRSLRLKKGDLLISEGGDVVFVRGIRVGFAQLRGNPTMAAKFAELPGNTPD